MNTICIYCNQNGHTAYATDPLNRRIANCLKFTADQSKNILNHVQNMNCVENLDYIKRNKFTICNQIRERFYDSCYQEILHAILTYKDCVYQDVYNEFSDIVDTILSIYVHFPKFSSFDFCTHLPWIGGNPMLMRIFGTAFDNILLFDVGYLGEMCFEDSAPIEIKKNSYIRYVSYERMKKIQETIDFFLKKGKINALQYCYARILGLNVAHREFEQTILKIIDADKDTFLDNRQYVKMCIANDYTECVKVLVNMYPVMCSDIDQDGNLLHYACTSYYRFNNKHDLETIKFLSLYTNINIMHNARSARDILIFMRHLLYIDPWSIHIQENERKFDEVLDLLEPESAKKRLIEKDVANTLVYMFSGKN